MTITPTFGKLSAFCRHRGGMAALEFAFILPLLLILLLGAVGTFDLYKADRAASVAANTVIDLTARQAVMNDTIRDTLFAAGQGLVGRYNSGSGISMTLASIVQDPDDGLEVAWSESTGSGSTITDADISSLDLPTIPNNESIIYIRLSSNYAPMFGSGLTFEREAVRRPRYVAAIAYDD
ncbi:MAG: hypothetical protein AAF199_00590 [Pseudomonadota bacterium]